MENLTNINYDLLKYFYYVATYKKISTAATKLFITQSALSQSIKTLEKQLNAQLFIRSSNGMKLTSSGEKFYKSIRQGNIIFEEAIYNLKNSKTENRETIKIGVSSVLAKHFLLPKLNALSEKYKNVKFKICTNIGYVDKVEQISTLDLDLAIVKLHKPFEQKNFSVTKIGELNYVFFYNPKFYNISDQISIQEFKSLPLILKNSGTNTRSNFDKLLNEPLNIKLEAGEDELIIDLVKSGLGVGYAPIQYLDNTLKTFKVQTIKDYSIDIVILGINQNVDTENIIKDFSQH